MSNTKNTFLRFTHRLVCSQSENKLMWNTKFHLDLYLEDPEIIPNNNVLIEKLEEYLYELKAKLIQGKVLKLDESEPNVFQSADIDIIL